MATDKDVLCTMLTRAGIKFKEVATNATVLNRKTGKQEDAAFWIAADLTDGALEGGSDFFFKADGALLAMDGWDWDNG